MRIVAGSARGRPLLGPKKDKAIRPTADRVRESLFNVLGQWMEGLSVLDLYAGTGALGLEALSRGARLAVLVDSGKEAQALCRANAAALGFSERVEVLGLPVARAAERLSAVGRSFELVFADPPYAAREVASLLELVGRHRLLAAGGVLVLEHERQEEAPESASGLRRTDQRRFGATGVSLYRLA